MKSTYSLALMLAAGTTLITGASLYASETDDRIVSSAKKSYVFKTYLSGDSITTESKDGVVTLTGTVTEGYHKFLARDTVAGLPGVKSVDNQLKVKDGAPAEYSDGWLATKVKSVLLFHRNVKCKGTAVSVDNGIATLRGEASSMAQKELTAEYAKDIKGIKEVKNEMTVAAAPAPVVETIIEAIDDASITAQVKFALMSHLSTNAVKTEVETVAGVVTLSGFARNAAEKSLVTKLASDINGVSKVINNMTIEVKAASISN